MKALVFHVLIFVAIILLIFASLQTANAERALPVVLKEISRQKPNRRLLTAASTTALPDQTGNAGANSSTKDETSNNDSAVNTETGTADNEDEEEEEPNPAYKKNGSVPPSSTESSRRNGNCNAREDRDERHAKASKTICIVIPK
ncbi:hypothetical protein CIPAW_02G073800 [Carya illinoinensis]|uniref:Uncharacterized protein n=1 Tax=Carya illinoinensis TaxID=32201 RepID=A0A8T1RC48_CARIL|nr:hypothetical protein CIPAW_02G073800 [Carya illinoinensis]KAG6726272.1 hypothetical protein I3842_02G072600 [Carya illinoinensis]